MPDGQGIHDEAYLKWLDRHGKARPVHSPHGEDSYENPISEHLKQLKPTSWRLEGNKLIGETEAGPLVNYIPTDYILKGTDDNGLPILVKIGT